MHPLLQLRQRLPGDRKAQLAAGPLIGFVVTFIIVLYLLAAMYSPIEGASEHLAANIGKSQTNESIGTAADDGTLVASVDYTPVEAGSETVYADGIPSGSWVNSSYTMFDTNGTVDVTASGDSNTTSGAVITVDYTRAVQVSNISGLSSLPGVVVLLFMLITILGLILAASRTGRL